MTDNNTALYIVLGLGGLYLLTRSSSAVASPILGSSAPRPASGSGASMGSGVTGGGSGSYQYKPTASSTPVNCPGSPGCPGYGMTDTSGQPDSGNPCDTTSVAYDAQLCNVMNGTDSQNPCDPTSYFYDASACSSVAQDVANQQAGYGIDTGDPCDPNSYAYDPTQCPS